MILGAPECASVFGGRALATTDPSSLSPHSFHVLPACSSSSCLETLRTQGPTSTWSQHYGLAPGGLLHISKDKGPRGKEGLIHHLSNPVSDTGGGGGRDSKGTRLRPRVPPLDPSQAA